MIGYMYLKDSKTHSFSAKVEECVADYMKKTDGIAPKIVLVNELDYKMRDTNKFSVPVRPDPVVLPNNFWVGEEKK